MAGHSFGGAWTEVKLEAIAAYLAYYNTRLRDQPNKDRPFKRWYIDAFAGSGSRTEETLRGGILAGEPISVEKIELAGSAKRALAVDPPFDRLLFIEPNRGRFADLAQLIEAHANRDLQCRRGDANTELANIFSQAPWANGGRANWSDRAVVFLDPYGMAVNWRTLEVLAGTRAVDVWYLFPLEAVNRQLAHDFDAIDAAKRARLDQIFGTDQWPIELYSTWVERDLWNIETARTGRRTDKAQIQEYAMQRLRTIFSYVSPPLPLVNNADRQLFTLLCLANPATPAATKAIKTGVKWVFSKYGPASHRMYDH